MKDVFTKEEVVKLIGLVTGSSHSFEGIVLEIAKTNPAALLDAMGCEDSDAGVVLKFIRRETNCSKIEAIKHVRAEKGLGLREAKDLVEEVASKYNFKFRDWT